MCVCVCVYAHILYDDKYAPVVFIVFTRRRVDRLMYMSGCVVRRRTQREKNNGMPDDTTYSRPCHER